MTMVHMLCQRVMDERRRKRIEEENIIFSTGCSFVLRGARTAAATVVLLLLLLAQAYLLLQKFHRQEFLYIGATSSTVVGRVIIKIMQDLRKV